MVFRPNRKRYIKSVKAAAKALSGLRVTARKRLQQRRTGQLHGAVPGATSRFRAKVIAARAGFRNRRRK